jgi:Rrf2 family iron-sulfur cluster assembly transcriptional regulator
MMLTTKGRYAVMAMADIANSFKENQVKNKTVKLLDVSNRQKIAISYLEQIFALLKAAKLVDSVKGPGGGYFLTKSPSQISIVEIIKAVDEPIKMTRCELLQKSGCISDSGKCLTHNLWNGLSRQIEEYLSSKTLGDLS